MLVLARRTGQSILIGRGGRIRIKILDISRLGVNAIVKIGIEAPREEPIFREEVFQRNKGQS
jgi:carbon storage regulator CsrA